MNGEIYIDTISGEQLITRLNSNGDKLYEKKHKLHRVDGPAVEYKDGSELWARNGLQHRMDGPATIIHTSNCTYMEYYINGVSLNRVELTRRWTQ